MPKRKSRSEMGLLNTLQEEERLDQGPSRVVRAMREQSGGEKGRLIVGFGFDDDARGALRRGRQGVLRSLARSRRQRGRRRGRREDLPVLQRASRVPRQREVAARALRRLRAHRGQEPPPRRERGQIDVLRDQAEREPAGLPGHFGLRGAERAPGGRNRCGKDLRRAGINSLVKLN